MKSRTLDYVSPGTPRARRRWPWRVLTVVGVLFFAVAVLPAITLRQVESRVDAVTGSMTWKTVWLYGLASETRMDVSPLETRLRSSGVQWKPDWKFLHNTHRNIFGSATCYECGFAPPIYHLRPVIEEYAAMASDQELREFVRVMQAGTKAQQRAAVDAAADKALPPWRFLEGSDNER